VYAAPVDAVSSARERFARCKYFGSLDGLRGISIVAVIWHHAGGHVDGILGRGRLGVQLFFAISGLLITTLLLREQRKNGSVSLRGFYIRRTLRIFPLYYAVLALYVALVWTVEHSAAPRAQFFANLPFYATYTSNWFVDLESGNRVIFYFAWSLATEEQFYLFWPSTVRFARRWYVPVVVMGLLLLASEAARWGVAGGYLDSHHVAVRVFTSIAAPICFGCLAAYLLDRPRGFRVAYLVLAQPWSAPLAAVLLALCVAFDAPMLLISLVMACLVTTCAIRPDHLLRRALENRVLRYLGTISYGMYLLHMLAVNAARRLVGFAHSPGLTFVVALLAVTALASMSYYFFERRFLRMKDKFAQSPRQLESVAADAAS
jgi:peptidoglycan/LPS O-acetylase OafA/YrhL